MGRDFRKLIRIKGTLVTRTPVHVGGERGDAIVDLVLVLDGLGNPVIPGTSLAGALRAWACSYVEDVTLVDRVFGFEEEKSDKGQAARLVVQDGIVAASTLPIQTHTAVDRWSGTAYDRTLHARETIPRGATISLQLTLESSSDADEALLGHLLHQMQQPGGVRLGAAKTRGLGEVELTACSIEQEDWTSRDGVVRALSGEYETPSIDDLKNRAELKTKQRRVIDITVGWNPLLPVMVAETGDEIDISTRTETHDQRVYLSLPGSAIKGALRSRAEHIVRTLTQEDLDAPGLPGRQWEQISVDVVDDLFGVILHHGDESQRSRGNIGALSVSSIRSITSVGADEWSSLHDVSKKGVDNSEARNKNIDQLLRNVNGSLLDASDDAQVDVATHVAIDRFSGGAAESALYMALEPQNFTWEPLRLAVDLGRLPEDARPALGLLLATLSEFCNGWVPLGFGSGRGYGAVGVTSVTFVPPGVNIEGEDVGLGVALDADGSWNIVHTEAVSALAAYLGGVTA